MKRKASRVTDTVERIEGGHIVQTITMSIPNINCNHCIMTVKREGSMVKGAEFVGGDIAAKTATFKVDGDEALAALKATLAEAGYPAA
jgi:copper chaperone CopZ